MFINQEQSRKLQKSREQRKYFRIGVNVFNWEYHLTAETEPSITLLDKIEAGSLFLRGHAVSGGYPLRYIDEISQTQPQEFSIWKQRFIKAHELESMDEWLDNPMDENRILEFFSTYLGYNKKRDILKEDGSSYTLNARFTDSTQYLDLSDHTSLKQQRIFSELLNKSGAETRLSSQVKILPSKIANVFVSTCVCHGNITLSEHHREQILDALRTFPQNCLNLEFEGNWTDISHSSNVDSSTVDIRATAILNPSTIDITVLSDQISE